MRCMLLLVLSILIYPSVLSAGEVLKQYTTEERQLEQTKLTVIKELAEMGVNNAYAVLAEMSEDRPLVNPPSQDQLVRWYTFSAQSGNANGLLWLGHYFLHGMGKNTDREYNALILLAAASILGNVKATNDLVLIPKILGVSYAQLEKAFHEAMQNLSKGQAIDCSWLECNPGFSVQVDRVNNRLSQKTEVFRDNWKQSNITSVYQYLKLLDTEKLLARSSNTSALKEEMKTENIGKLKKNERMARERRLAENPDWEMETYLDRLNSRRLSAQDALKHYENQDFVRLEKDIRHTIDLINFHRDPNAQVSHEEVLQQMREAP